SPRLGDCGTHHIHITRATRGRSPALRLAPRWMPTTVNARDIGAPWGPLMLDAAPNRWRMLKRAGRTVLILGALRNAPVRVATLPKLDVAGSSPVARSDAFHRGNGVRRGDNVPRRFVVGHICWGTFPCQRVLPGQLLTALRCIGRCDQCRPDDSNGPPAFSSSRANEGGDCLATSLLRCAFDVAAANRTVSGPVVCTR